MIYYFLMRSGDLVSLDCDPLATEVAVLKQKIVKKECLPEANLILIANGGLCIHDGIVDDYKCGDEHNPIFLYAKQAVRPSQDFIVTETNIEYERVWSKLSALLDGNQKLGSNLEILIDLEEAAVDVCLLARRQAEAVDTAVRDQFLLVDGWSAALANLSDSVGSLDRRICAARTAIARFHTEEKEDCDKFDNELTGLKMSEQYRWAKSKLKDVPLLDVLRDDSGDDDLGFNGVNEEDKVASITPSSKMMSPPSSPRSTLLDWVDERDRQLESLVAEAEAALVELGSCSAYTITTSSSNSSLLGRAGLCLVNGERLVALCRSEEQMSSSLMSGITCTSGEERRSYMSSQEFYRRLDKLAEKRKLAGEELAGLSTHREYMTSIVRQCANSLGKVVLEDHCSGALMQTRLAGERLRRLSQLAEQVQTSKADLVNNVAARARWLEDIETRVCAIDECLFVTRDRLRKVRVGKRVIDQMRLAPGLYGRGLVELARREAYQQCWLSWGRHISVLTENVRQADLETAATLSKELESHFLQALFHQLCCPSPLPKLGQPLLKWAGNKSPPGLRAINVADLEGLSDQIPSLREALTTVQPILALLPLYETGSAHRSEPGSDNSSSRATRKMTDSFNIYLMSAPCDDGIAVAQTAVEARSEEPANDGAQSVGAGGPDNTSEPTHVSLGDAGTSDDAASDIMFQSINSQEFQSHENKAVQTLLDAAFISDWSLGLSAVKADLAAVQDICTNHRAAMTATLETARSLVDAVSSVSLTKPEALPVDSSVVRKTMTESTISNNLQMTLTTSNEDMATSNDNSVTIVLKQFCHGDQVIFMAVIGQQTSRTGDSTIPMQWRMLSADAAIYFLHGDCIPAEQHQNLANNPALPLVTAIFRSKDEYKCKKKTNRYGLPENTRFHLVNAIVDWSSLTTAPSNRR